MPTSSEKLKSFLGALQYIAKIRSKLSKKTDRLRQPLQKKSEWNWTEREEADINEIKIKITKLPCLANFPRNRDNILSTEASRTGLGRTLWKNQNDDTFRRIAFAGRYLNDAEKSYSIGQLKLLAVV